MNPSADPDPDPGTFDSLNHKRQCDDDDDEPQDAATVGDKIRGANLEKSGNSNPPNVTGPLAMESPSGIHGREA